MKSVQPFFQKFNLKCFSFLSSTFFVQQKFSEFKNCLDSNFFFFKIASEIKNCWDETAFFCKIEWNQLLPTSSTYAPFFGMQNFREINNCLGISTFSCKIPWNQILLKIYPLFLFCKKILWNQTTLPRIFYFFYKYCPDNNTFFFKIQWNHVLLKILKHCLEFVLFCCKY